MSDFPFALDESEPPTPRDPEEASRSLAEVQELLRRLSLVRDLARRETGADHLRQSLTERVAEAQHLSHLRARIDRLHPADVAFILEALPPEDRLTVWGLVDATHDGEVLVEVSGSVREGLIRHMDRGDLLAAAASLDADDLADSALLFRRLGGPLR